MNKEFLSVNGVYALWKKIISNLKKKQDLLISGETIKTINNESILGCGDLDIKGVKDIKAVASAITLDSDDKATAEVSLDKDKETLSFKFGIPKGPKGEKGLNGNDGASAYVYAAYASSKDGLSGFSFTPTDDTTYIGFCTTNSIYRPREAKEYDWINLGNLGKGNAPKVEIIDGYWYIDGINTGIIARGTNGTGVNGTSWRINDGWWEYMNDGDTEWTRTKYRIENYELPIATKTRLGGIKVGKGLTIDAAGVLSATTPDIDYSNVEYIFKSIFCIAPVSPVPTLPSLDSTLSTKDYNTISFVNGNNWVTSYNSDNIPKGNTVWWALATFRKSDGKCMGITSPVNVGINAGADSDSVDFIFYKTNISPEKFNQNPNVASENSNGVAIPKPYQPTGKEAEWSEDVNTTDKWTDNPKGVGYVNGILYMYEYISITTKTGDSWSPWSTPVLWAKWGANGTDGDGVQYAFFRTSEFVAPTIDDVHLGKYDSASKESLPTTTTKGVKYTWEDDPKGVTKTLMYEWVSKRTYDGRNKQWSDWSQPALWASYSETPEFKYETKSYYYIDVDGDNTNDGMDTKTAAIEQLIAAGNQSMPQVIATVTGKTDASGLGFIDATEFAKKKSEEYKGAWLLTLEFVNKILTGYKIQYLGTSSTAVTVDLKDSYIVDTDNPVINIPVNLQYKTTQQFKDNTLVYLRSGSECIHINNIALVDAKEQSLYGITFKDNNPQDPSAGWTVSYDIKSGVTFTEKSHRIIFKVTDNDGNDYVFSVRVTLTPSMDGFTYYRLVAAPDTTVIGGIENIQVKDTTIDLYPYKVVNGVQTLLNHNECSIRISAGQSIDASGDLMAFSGNSEYKISFSNAGYTGTSLYEYVTPIGNTKNQKVYFQLWIDDKCVDIEDVVFVYSEVGATGPSGYTPKFKYVFSASNTEFKKKSSDTQGYPLDSTLEFLRNHNFEILDEFTERQIETAVFSCMYYVDSNGQLVNDTFTRSDGTKSAYSRWQLFAGSVQNGGIGGTGLTGIPGIDYIVGYIISPTTIDLKNINASEAWTQAFKCYAEYVKGEQNIPNFEVDKQAGKYTFTGNGDTKYVIYNTFNNANHYAGDDEKVYTIQGRVDATRENESSNKFTYSVSDISIVDASSLDANNLQARTGYIVYYAGIWDTNTNYSITKVTTKVNGQKVEYRNVPYVTYTDNEGNTGFYILDNALAETADGYSKLNNTQKTPNSGEFSVWTKMSSFSALYTRLLLAGRGQINTMCFYNNWMFSTQGKGTNKDATTGSTYNYSHFKAEEDDWSSATKLWTPNFAVNTLTGNVYMGGGITKFNYDGSGNIGKDIEWDSEGNLKTKTLVTNVIGVSLVELSYPNIRFTYTKDMETKVSTIYYRINISNMVAPIQVTVDGESVTNYVKGKIYLNGTLIKVGENSSYDMDSVSIDTIGVKYGRTTLILKVTIVPNLDTESCNLYIEKINADTFSTYTN